VKLQNVDAKTMYLSASLRAVRTAVEFSRNHTRNILYQHFVMSTRNFCISLFILAKRKWYRSSVFTIRYDTVYLTCSKKLTGSQLSPSHGKSLTDI